MDLNFRLPQLFEPEKTPKHLHIGLRMIKTALAVFVCALLGFLRGHLAFFSMIAAVICIQPTTEQTIVTAFNRTVGTLIGGLCDMGAVYIGEILYINETDLLFLVIVSLSVIPVILFALAIKKPSAAAFSCMVFIAVTVLRTADISPFLSAMHRIIDTEIGILVALIVNIGIPHHEHHETNNLHEHKDHHG